MAIDYYYTPEMDAVKFVDTDGNTFTVSLYALMEGWQAEGINSEALVKLIKQKGLLNVTTPVTLHPPVPPVMTEEI